MKLIKKWNEYMGPKDERLEAESSRYVRLGYYLLLGGAVICLYYSLMLNQVADTTDTPILTAVGASVIPTSTLLMAVILIACFVPLFLQMRAGIVSEHSRFAQVDRIPWELVSWCSALAGAVVAALAFGLRIAAEIQIVGVEQVTWGGDFAIAVVYFILAFLLAFAFSALVFRDAIKHRQKLEHELDE